MVKTKQQRCTDFAARNGRDSASRLNSTMNLSGLSARSREGSCDAEAIIKAVDHTQVCGSIGRTELCRPIREAASTKYTTSFLND